MSGITTLGGALLFLGASVLTGNLVFTRFFGAVPYAGGKLKASARLGLYLTCAMTLASLVAQPVYQLLVSLEADYLSPLCFLLVSLGAAGLVILAVKLFHAKEYEAMGGAWKLMLLDSALLGVVLLNAWSGYDLIKSVLSGLFGGLGFTFAVVLLAGIRDRLSTSKVPAALRGLPITLISAGLISLAFLGFMGMFH